MINALMWFLHVFAAWSYIRPRVIDGDRTNSSPQCLVQYQSHNIYFNSAYFSVTFISIKIIDNNKTC